MLSTRYERLGFSREQLHIDVHLKCLEHDLLQYKTRGLDWYFMPMAISSCSDTIALRYYCLEDIASTRRYAVMCAEHSIESLFGAWRDEVASHKNRPPSRELWRRYGGWASELQAGILWASCLNDWERVTKLAEYPASDCPIGRFETKQEGYWLLALAGTLRGDDTQRTQYFEVIRKCKSRYHKRLLTMLEAIIARDVVGYEKGLAQHLAYCHEFVFNQPYPRLNDDASSNRTILREQFREMLGDILAEDADDGGDSDTTVPRGIPSVISRDGTILHHYARHLGLKVVWPEEDIDRLVSLD
jgi:hypothetical protein